MVVTSADVWPFGKWCLSSRQFFMVIDVSLTSAGPFTWVFFAPLKNGNGVILISVPQFRVLVGVSVGGGGGLALG